MTSRTAAFTCFCLGLCALTASALAPARAQSALEHWRAHDPESERTLDHGDWTDFLQRYLVRDGARTLMAYGAVEPPDHRELKAYIEQLADIPVTTLSRPVQKAYWINLYNALTVDVVLDHYPVETIRDIDSGLFDDGPWDEERITVESRALSLDDIEHRILRAIWHDPMIHYGLNCAALGCPNLLERAYTAERVETMLAANARDYIGHGPGILRISGESVKVSSIYVWYEADFGEGEDDILAHLRNFAAGERAAALERVRRIGGHDYGWSLNDARRKAATSW